MHQRCCRERGNAVPDRRVCVADAVGHALRLRTPSDAPSGTPSPTVDPSPSPPAFDTARFSTTDPASPWVVVNKLRPLTPADYVPETVPAQVPAVSNPDMRPAAAAALAAMFAVAASEGAGRMQIQNAYRSFALQTSVHDRLVASLGKEAADAQSARPGFSEHQTGLAVDIVSFPAVCSIQLCFGETPQGAWLAQHSWRFGFILRYPGDKSAITGYIFEPWHFRFVGPELSVRMHELGVTTLEEFFGLPAAPDYAG